ncbi:MAG: YHS domain-containing (seleno)protein [Gemmatimonadota bacterium]
MTHSTLYRTLSTTFAALALTATAYAGKQPQVNVDRGGSAVKGYDVVAYVTDGKPVEGNATFETTWNGATWRFASAAHRDLFRKDPEKFAPQFGGYCSWAVSRGYTADVDPQAWKIVDGRLYLNYSKSVQEKWSQDIPGNIAKARANWPKVLEK